MNFVGDEECNTKTKATNEVKNYLDSSQRSCVDTTTTAESSDFESVSSQVKVKKYSKSSGHYTSDSGSEVESENEKICVVEVPSRPRRRHSMGRQKSSKSIAKDSEEDFSKLNNKNVTSESDDSPVGSKKKKKIRVIVKRIDLSNIDSESIVSELSETDSEKRKKKKAIKGRPLSQSESDSEEETTGSDQIVANAKKGDKRVSKDDKKDSAKITRWLEKLGKIGTGNGSGSNLTRSASGKGLNFQRSSQSRSSRSLLGDKEGEEEESLGDDESEFGQDVFIEVTAHRSENSELLHGCDSMSTDCRLNGNSDHSTYVGEGKNTPKISRNLSDCSENIKPSILRTGRLQNSAVTRNILDDSNSHIDLVSKGLHQSISSKPSLSLSDHSKTSLSSHELEGSGFTRRSRHQTPTKRDSGPSPSRSRSGSSRGTRTSVTVANVLAEADVSFSRRMEFDADKEDRGKKSLIQRSRSERLHGTRQFVDTTTNQRKVYRQQSSDILEQELNCRRLQRSNSGSYLPTGLNETKDDRRQNKSKTTELDEAGIQKQRSPFVQEDAMDDVKTRIKLRRPSLKILAADDSEPCPFANSHSSNPIGVGKYFTPTPSVSTQEITEQNLSKKPEIIPLKLKGALSATPRSSSRPRSNSRSRSRSKSRSNSSKKLTSCFVE